jgi:hypothetical protein
MRTFSLIWSGIGCFATVAITVLGGVILTNWERTWAVYEGASYDSLEAVLKAIPEGSILGQSFFDMDSSVLFDTNGQSHKITVIKLWPELEINLHNGMGSDYAYRLTLDVPFGTDYGTFMSMFLNKHGNYTFAQTAWSNFSDVILSYDKNGIDYSSIFSCFYQNPDGLLYAYEEQIYRHDGQQYQYEKYQSLRFLQASGRIFKDELGYLFDSHWPIGSGRYLVGSGDGWYYNSSYKAYRYIPYDTDGKYTMTKEDKKSYDNKFNNIAIFRSGYYYVEGYVGGYTWNLGTHYLNTNFVFVKHEYYICVESADPLITAHIQPDE